MTKGGTNSAYNGRSNTNGVGDAEGGRRRRGGAHKW